MIFHDINQNTDEWHQLRAGKITSSALSKAMANFGKAFGEPAKKYAVSIAVEQLTGVPISSDYTNDHMARGHDEEPIARMLYEQEYFCEVSNGGFFDLGDIGCSPDGLVYDDGVIEIKSAIPSIHFERIKRKKYDSAYRWQLAGNLKFTGREWIDFISYCSQFPEDKRLFVHRSTKDDFKDEFDMIDERIDEFRALIENTKEIIINQ
jgi:hypothetical protein